MMRLRVGRAFSLGGWKVSRHPWVVPAVVAVLLLSTGCDELFVDPAPGSDSMALSLGLAADDGLAVGGALEAFKKADRVWIRLTRVSTGAQFDTIVRLSRGETTARVQLAVSADQGRGPIQVATQVRLVNQALFEGATVAALEVGVPQRVEIALVAVPAGISVPETVRDLTAIGDSARLSAAVLFATGDTIPGLPITWISDTPAVAAITSGSFVVARGEGEALLTAGHGSFSGTVPVRVAIEAASVEAASVVVSPDSITVSVGESGTFHASVFDRFGNELDRPVEWASERPAVVSIDASGQATALAVGISKVAAKVGDVKGEAVVRVVP